MDPLELSGLTPPSGCNFTFGGMSGIFDLTTARIPPSSTELTFVTANFRDFDHLGGTEEKFGLRFDGVTVKPEDNWFPANIGEITSLEGGMVTWSVSESSDAVQCNSQETQRWKISVQAE